MSGFSIVPLGDRALTIDIDADAFAAPADVVRGLAEYLHAEPPLGVVAIVPALRSITLHYEPTATTFAALRDQIDTVTRHFSITPAVQRHPIVIPVCYGGEFGPDLEVLASTHRTTAEAIVAAHTAGEYTVAMLGFLPGFPYLHGLPATLYTPRRAEPRTRVPAGSVGIGGSSTGIYPCESPGGWQLIGRTPRALFNPHRDPPALLQVGDRVRFVDVAPAVLHNWVEHA